MQLILNTDPDIDIRSNMSVIEQESLSLDTKIINNDVTNKIQTDIPSITEFVTISNDKENLTDIEVLEKDENVINGNIDNDNAQNKNSADKDSNEGLSNINVVIGNKEVADKVDDFDSNKENENNTDVQEDLNAYTNAHEIELQTETSEEKSKSDKPDVTDTEFTMRVKNVKEINENVLEKDTCKEDEEVENTTDNTENVKDSPVQDEIQSESKNDEIFDLEEDMDDESNQKTSSSVKNDEVIDIADEKDDECITVMDDKVSDVGKESEKPEKIIISENSTCNENNAINTNMENIEEENLVNKTLEYINNDEHANTENLKDSMSNLIQDKELDNKSSIEIDPEVTVKKINNLKEKKPLLHLSKLSNTLDILSDDDEEQVPEVVPENKESDEKQCISIEDDDDIMLIDEETPIDTNKNDSLVPPDTDIPQDGETKHLTTENESDITMNVDESSEEPLQESKVDNETVKETNEKDKQLDENIEQTEKKPSSPKPLLPVNFLKSCKRNFAEMTREELEEFCVLKIVESVVDRSNLSEMNLQLKAMSQNIEDYKKKTNTLLKQNRDLQVVLKSIQEEQKKNTGQAIAPLKITRSVGMQVLMIETPIARKRPSNKFPANSHNPAKLKSQSPKTLKGPTNSTNDQQIPVPRLVPAVNSAATNIKQISSPLATKPQVSNGVRSSPPSIKPEKRSFNKMQQGNSITVDLTDDEPPSKVVPRNIAPPVRLVPQQSLLTSQRPQFVNTANNPRKVYIPISGSQNPVRPGQTIMLKQVPPHVPRLRGPGAVQKCNSVRLPRIAPKHPAPLPDSTKQYQPPNWKALPPAPELKLSKVENGIVISWKIDGYQEENHEEIASYQLYAYQETSSPPSTSLWKKIGDVKALPLPMACTLTQFMAGYKYYFAVRAVDIRSRLGPFSLPGSILLLNKM